MNESQEFEREYLDSIEDFELTSEKFKDPSFSFSDQDKLRPPKNAFFIKPSSNGVKYEINIEGIKQGRLGDCWFIGSGESIIIIMTYFTLSYFTFVTI